MKTSIRTLLKTGLAFIALVLIYVLVSAVLMLFPVNSLPSAIQPATRADPAISLTHDLAHVNIMIDLSQSSLPWQTLLPDLIPEKKGYLLVGWGDKQTYLSTPSWADLTVSVALKALLTNTPSALHLRYLPYKQNLRVEVTPLWISEISAQAIEQKIMNTFVSATSNASNPQLMSPGYDDGDRFYYSRGHYNLFNTCNTWVGDVLRQSGVAVSRWTPFSYNVIYSIPKALRY